MEHQKFIIPAKVLGSIELKCPKFDFLKPRRTFHHLFPSLHACLLDCNVCWTIVMIINFVLQLLFGAELKKKSTKIKIPSINSLFILTLGSPKA